MLIPVRPHYCPEVERQPCFSPSVLQRAGISATVLRRLPPPVLELSRLGSPGSLPFARKKKRPIAPHSSSTFALGTVTISPASAWALLPGLASRASKRAARAHVRLWAALR